MKAIILAAGYGTRLGKLTQNKAKPLLSVAGKPIIEHIIAKINILNYIDQKFIVTNNKFFDNFVSWLDQTIYTNIKIINDGTTSKEERLGAIGDINFVIKQEKIDDDILIVGGDNLFEDNLTEFLAFFHKKGSSIMLHDVESKEVARQLGIVSLNEEQKIISFVEKPEEPHSTLASTLIYALKKEHLSLIEEALSSGFADRAGDFIKYLSEKEPVFARIIKGRWFDIGNLEQLEEASQVYTNEN